MSEHISFDVNYYLNIETQQQELINSQELNLKFLNENFQEVEDELNKNQILLQDIIKSKEILKKQELNLFNENNTLLESYKSYQEFFQTHTAQLKEEVSLIKEKVKDCDSYLEKCDDEMKFYKEKISNFSRIIDKKAESIMIPQKNRTSIAKVSFETSNQENITSSVFRANTMGNEILVHSKKEIEKFLNLDDRKTLERRHSYTVASKEHRHSINFEELKQNNFSLMKEIYDINTNSNNENFESESQLDDSLKKSQIIGANMNMNESTDNKVVSFASAISLTNIPKNDPSYDTDNNSEEKSFMKNLKDKDKFADVDLKYLHNDINYPQNLIKSWNDDVIELIKSKQKKSKILSKIQSKIKENLLPKCHRPFIWKLLIGNPLKIKKEMYEKLTNRLHLYPLPKKIYGIIKEDLLRTFPKLKVFTITNSNFEKLQRILQIFSSYRADIGYVQGMAYLSTIIFFHFNEFDTFKYFTNLVLSSRLLIILFSFQNKKIEIYFKTFLFFLEEKNPLVVAHLQNYGLDISMFLVEWFYTLYTRAFSLEFSVKIWDLFLFYGEIIIIKVALAIFGLAESHLLKCRFEESIFYMRNCTFELKEELILKHIYNNKLTIEKWDEKFLSEIKNSKKISIDL